MKNRFIQILPFIAIFFLWGLFSTPSFSQQLVPFPSRYLVTFFPPWNAAYGMPVKNNAMPDVITQIYPWKKMTIDMWKQGNIPLWNPYAFAGTPQAANFQSAVFSPINILFFLFPFVFAWSAMILLQPLIAGVGMYIFIRSLDRSRLASVCSAIAFMFCGFITTWMAYGTLGYAILLLPWILWCITIIYKRQTAYTRLLLPFFVAWSLLSGHFQISLYVLMATFLYIMFKSFEHKNWSEGIRTAVGVLLGVGIASPQLLLTYQAYEASTRATSFVRAEVIPWQYLLTLFSPDFFGNPITRNDWFGHYAEWASYIGVIPLIFAFYSFMNFIKGYKIYFLLLIAIVIFLAFPTPIGDLVYWLKVPILSTSAASRIIVLLSFSLAALSAFGIDEFMNTWKAKDRKKLILFSIGITFFIVVLWVVLYVGKPLSLDKLSIAKRNMLLPTALAITTIGLMISGFLFKKTNIKVFMVMILLSLTGFDSYRFVTKWMPFDEEKYIYPETKTLTYLKNTVGTNRVFGNIGGEVGNTYGLSLIEGYDAMYQARFGEFINASSNGIVSPSGRSVVTFDKYGIYKDRVLQLLGVRYIVHRKSDGRNVWAFPIWQYKEGDIVKKFEDEHYEVYEYTKSYPRAYFVSSYEVITDAQQIIDKLFSVQFNLQDSVILESEPEGKPQIGDGTATIEKYSPNYIRIHTDSNVSKLLFLSDVFDSGWKVTIDGKLVTLYRANYDFRAVFVPAGMHTVEYTYKPDFIKTSFLVSLLSIFISIALFLFVQKKNHI